MVIGSTVGHFLVRLSAEFVRLEPIGVYRPRRLFASGFGYFPMYNRSKQSIFLNLGSDVGLAVGNELIDKADALVENVKPGALDGLGRIHEDCAKSNPLPIYSSENGFLPGPYEQPTALEEVAQMMIGLA